MRCIWLLLLLWGSTSFANFASFPLNRSIDIRDATWYPLRYIPRLGSSAANLISEVTVNTAYYEAVSLAHAAYEALDGDDPIYRRYFRKEDFSLVKDIFGSISGALDGNAPRGSSSIVNAMFCEGSCPLFPNLCENSDWTAACCQGLVYPVLDNAPGLAPGAAAISLCDPFYGFHLLAERSCGDILGDNDNLLMISRGSLMLHELTHWRTLNQKAAGYLSTIQGRMALDHIADYAYGPAPAHLLTTSGNSASAVNADSYQFYAISKFWQTKCPEKNGGRGWGTAVNNERPGPPVSPNGRCRDEYDGLLRDGNTNAVPQ